METRIVKEVKYGCCGNEDFKVVRWSNKYKGVLQIVPEDEDFDEPCMYIQKDDVEGLIKALQHATDEEWIPSDSQESQ